ncbi:MAG: methane monooxygenase [Methylococcaceae bacterium]
MARVKFKRDYNLVWYNTPARDEWREKVDALSDLDEGVSFLLNFRKKYLGPFRETHELDKENNWIEARIEERVAVLKSEAFSDNQDLMHKTACGDNAAEVCQSFVDRAKTLSGNVDMTALCEEFRRTCKPPIMPINYFMENERILVEKLMKERADGYYDISLEDLRKRSGATVIV